MSTNTLERPASDKQLAFIDRMLAERQVSDEYRENVDVVREAGLNVLTASAIISNLMMLPEKPQPQATPGYYVHDDRVFVVVENRAGTRTYAKRLDVHNGRGRWTYAPGAVRMLADAEPLTVDEAARLGRAYGACMICGRTLTDPESVERGIGPVCAARL